MGTPPGVPVPRLAISPPRKGSGGNDIPITNLAFSPKGDWPASGDRGGYVRLWDARTGAALGLQPKPEADPRWPIEALAFAPDGLTVASIGQKLTNPDIGYSVPLFRDMVSRKPTEVRPGDRTRQLIRRGLAYAPTGAIVASGGESIVIYKVKTGEMTHRFKVRSDCEAGAFTPDGAGLVTGHDDGTIVVWNVKTRRKARDIKAHTDAVTALALAPDGTTLASADDGGSIRLWDLPSGEARGEHRGDWDRLGDLAWLPSHLGVVSLHFLGDRASIRRWAPGDQEAAATWAPKGGDLWCMAVSRDGLELVIGSTTGDLKVWDLDAVLPPRRPGPGRTSRPRAT